MIWLVLALCSLAAAEFAMRLPLMASATRLAKVASKSFAVIGASQVSDHWKEKAISRYSRDMLVGSLKLALLSVALLSPFIVGTFAVSLLAPGTEDALYSWQGIAWCTLMATAYILVRQRIVR